MRHALLTRRKPLVQLPTELGANVDTLDRTVRRKSRLFTRLFAPTTGSTQIALVERRPA